MMETDVYGGSGDVMTQTAPVHPGTPRRKGLLIAAGLFRAAISATNRVPAPKADPQDQSSSPG